MIDRFLRLESHASDSMDVQPRGESCDQLIQEHDWFLTTQAAGFTYKICGRCGTVRITERR